MPAISSTPTPSARRKAGGICGSFSTSASYRVNGKPVREKLGTLAQIPNVADARELARQSMTKARSGANPVEVAGRLVQQGGQIAVDKFPVQVTLSNGEMKLTIDRVERD